MQQIIFLHRLKFVVRALKSLVSIYDSIYSMIEQHDTPSLALSIFQLALVCLTSTVVALAQFLALMYYTTTDSSFITLVEPWRYDLVCSSLELSIILFSTVSFLSLFIVLIVVAYSEKHPDMEPDYIIQRYNLVASITCLLCGLGFLTTFIAFTFFSSSLAFTIVGAIIYAVASFIVLIETVRLCRS